MEINRTRYQSAEGWYNDWTRDRPAAEIATPALLRYGDLGYTSASPATVGEVLRKYLRSAAWAEMTTEELDIVTEGME